MDWEFTLTDQSPPLALQFKDAAGAPLNLTGRTAYADLRNLSTGGVLTVPLTPRAQTGADVGWADFGGWTGSEFGAMGADNVLVPAVDANGRALGEGFYVVQGYLVEAHGHYPNSSAQVLGRVVRPLRGR